MKICITGTHSTGKTTLINEFKATRKEYYTHVLEEQARILIHNGVTMGKLATVDSYLQYINEQLRREIDSKQMRYDILLADRSLIDGLAHPIINKKRGADIPEYFIEMFERILYLQKGFYDFYVYLPIETLMTSDKVRPEDELYRQEIDQMIVTLLNRHIGKYFTLRGSIEEKCATLSEIIDRLTNQE